MSEESVAEEVVLEILAHAIAHYLPIPLPPSVVRGALRLAYRAVGELDIHRILVQAMGSLGYPQLVGDVEEAAAKELESEVPSGNTAEVVCPVSGDTIELEDGDGEYECPDCGADIVVDNLEAEHESVLTYVCPNGEVRCGVPLEEDEWYECTFCDDDVYVYADNRGRLGVAHGTDTEQAPYKGKVARRDQPAVICPATGDIVPLIGGDGEYECPDCGGDIAVENNLAEHEEMLFYECPQSKDICWVTPEVDECFECQDCGRDLHVYEGTDGDAYAAHEIDYEWE